MSASGMRLLNLAGARGLVGVLMLALSACGVDDRAAGQPVAGRAQAVTCNAGNAGGDLTCACTDNPQCNNFDDDTRLIICNVPTGGTVGTCYDCAALASGRPVGCYCSADADCATGSKCNGRTCQVLSARGEFCTRDTDCAADAMGATRCLPTKHWCGPLADTYPCDFGTDCTSGICSGLGVCTSGVMGTGCTKDSECATGTICYTLTATCVAPQPDGGYCLRNAECVNNQCNSFTGVCLIGTEGIPCTITGNAAGANGDCQSPLLCTDCGGSYNCRPTGSLCE